MNSSRDTSKRLCFDFSDVEINDYIKITESIKNKFELEVAGKLVQGFNEIFQDYKSKNLVIGLEWDTWFGYIVIAKSKDSEPLAKEIAQFINRTTQKKVPDS